MTYSYVGNSMPPLISSEIPLDRLDCPAISPDARYSVFLGMVGKASGELLPLARRSKLNEQFFLSARGGECLEFESSRKVTIVNIDLFATQRADEIKAIGMYDWEIEDGVANGNLKKHCKLAACHPAHDVADMTFCWHGRGLYVDESTIEFMKWSKGRTFSEYSKKGAAEDGVPDMSGCAESERVYWGQGVASLLIVASAAVLRERGAHTMDLGTLSPLAQILWSKFGVDGSLPNTCVSPYYVLQHVRSKRTVESFLRPMEGATCRAATSEAGVAGLSAGQVRPSSVTR